MIHKRYGGSRASVQTPTLEGPQMRPAAGKSAGKRAAWTPARAARRVSWSRAWADGRTVASTTRHEETKSTKSCDSETLGEELRAPTSSNTMIYDDHWAPLPSRSSSDAHF